MKMPATLVLKRLAFIVDGTADDHGSVAAIMISRPGDLWADHFVANIVA